MLTTTIDIWGFDMEVHYDYQPEELDVGLDEHCDVHTVMVGDVDIYAMLSGKQLARIEEAALQAHAGQAEQYALEAAIDRWEASL